MSASERPRRFRYVRLVAPVVLILFTLGWYRFSVVYIQAANDQLVASNNLAVYVPIQQITGYLAALLDATYLIVGVSLVILAYNLVRFLQFRASRASAIQTARASSTSAA